MPIDGYNPQEFGKSLAEQAQQVVPVDLHDEQKKYIINKVYQFCILAGNALNQDQNINLTADQASIITQFIGEWTFHKSIDLIRANVPIDCWDQVLQEVAFAIFETAKYTQTSNLEADAAIALVEREVNASYEKTLRELITQGKIQEEELPKILSFSNIDQMAKAQQVPEQTEPMQELGDVSDDEAKAIKYASIAIILKSLPESKRQKILLNLDKLEASHIMAFMQLEDLEKRVNPAMVDRYLKEFRHNISSIKRTLYSQSANSIMSLKEKFTEIEIKNTLKEERPLVKDYVEYCLTDIPQSYSRIKFSMPVINVISSYIRAKLSAQYS